MVGNLGKTESNDLDDVLVYEISGEINKIGV